MPNANHETILIVFVAMTAVALMVQAIVLLAFFLAARKSYDKMRLEFEELRESAMPLMNASRDVLAQFGPHLARIAPHIEPITADLVKTAANVRVISTDAAEILSKV